MKRFGPTFYVLLAIIAAAVVFFGIKHFGGDRQISTLANKATANQPVAKVDGKKSLRVCLNAWTGYGPGLRYNHGMKANKDSRFVTEQGVPVQFYWEDDPEIARAGFESGNYDVLWTTVDMASITASKIKMSGGKLFFCNDISDGADNMTVIASIRSVNDLRGKKIGCAVPSPSLALLNSVLKAAGMTLADIQLIKFTKEPDVLQAYKAGKLDGGVLWSPDDKDAAQAVPGSHVLKSTRGTEIIVDAFWAKSDFIDGHRAELEGFVRGWLKSAAEMRNDQAAKEEAAKYLAEGFAGLPKDFFLEGIGYVRNATFGDNVNFFNLHGNYTGVTAENLYVSTGQDYAAMGLAPSQIPSWREVSDASILQGLMNDTSLNGQEQVATSAPTFSTPTTADLNAPAFATKHVTITFATNSAELSGEAITTITREVGDVIRQFRSMRVRVEGNTDNVGSNAVNIPLSERRAKAVKVFLVNTYNLDPNRIIVRGNGSRKPVADNATDEGRAANRRTDFELIEDQSAAR